MKQILALALLLLCSRAVHAQGALYTAGPFSVGGNFYVCPVPSGGTPCPAPSSIFTNIGLTSALSNPVPIPQGQTISFYVAPGQYTVQFPAASYSQIVSIGGGSGTNAPGTAGPMPQFALYTVYLNSGTVYARNNSTGNIDYSGTDAGPVINSILTNNTSTCGTVFFKTGDYLFNSMTLESTGGYTNFYYAVGIPANAGSANQYCNWNFVGEGSTLNGEGVAIPGSGVIFDITAAARTSCGTGHECIGFWHRPDTTNHTGNDVKFKDITVRLPDNQRGNEAEILMWEAATADLYNVNMTINSSFGGITCSGISAPVAGANHMIGFGSPMAGRNNFIRLQNVSAQGMDIAYDIEGEHSMFYSVSGFCNGNFAQYGRLGTFGSYTSAVLAHPGTWEKAIDQENINGITFGANLAQGSRLDILGYDIETLSTGSFTRSVNLTETNNGYSSGIITYTIVSANSGVISETPPNQLFSSGGVNFQLFEGTSAPNVAKSAISDTFTRPNGPAVSSGNNFLGPAWISNTSGSACTIASNAAVTGTAASSSCVATYVAQQTNADQFAKLTVSAINANANVTVNVRSSATANTQTGYYYFCKFAIGTNQRVIAKYVAGTYTQIPTTPANASTACNAGDTIELWAIGTTLIGFYTPSGGTRTLDLIGTDSSITSGQPGFQINDNAASSSPSATNFVAGSLPAVSLGGSQFGQASVASMYLSIGTAPTPTGTGACATITTQTPASIGSQAGSLKCTGTTGASTITLTFPSAQTASNGYRCSADDSTTVANKPVETSWTTTTCVLTIASVTANDVIVWNASPF